MHAAIQTLRTLLESEPGILLAFLFGSVAAGTPRIDSNEQHARLLTRHLLDVADFLPLQQRILKERRDQWIK